MEIKTTLESIREFIKSGLTNETPSEAIENANKVLKSIDEVESSYGKLDTELKSCKDYIIDSVRNGGSNTPPKDEPTQPRSLLEIAQAIKNDNK